MTACQPFSDPRKVVTGCFDAVFRNDWEKAYGYFSFADRNTWNLDEYTRRHRLSSEDSCVSAMLQDRISCTVEEVLVSGDSARIILQITAPEIMVRGLTSFMELSSQMRCDSTLDADKVPHYVVNFTGSVLVLKEMDGWHVCGNWQEQQEAESRLAQDIIDYIGRSLKIKNIRIREYQGTQKTLLTAVLYNSGDRTVADVEIMVTCFSREDKPCFVLSEHPVNKGTKPLLKKSSRKFTIDISSVTPDWKKLANIKIVNCRFEH
jgi:hypothetical protein